jgi:C4-dicarboxylate transporter DctM subunit
MDQTSVLLLCVLLIMVFAGVEIAVCLGLIGMLAVYLSTQDVEITLSFLSNTAYEALRDYIFATVPLFLLMGEFIARSGVASDLFWAVDKWMRRIPGRLAYTTVIGNVVFSFVSGNSISAATMFTSIAYPPMKRFGYDKSFSLGLIAGTACLGPLIPPSLLMVVWGILTDVSIGHLFLAGIIPGFILAFMMAAYIYAVAIFRPHLIGHKRRASGELDSKQEVGLAVPAPERRHVWISVIGTFAILFGALGGIWVGIFTPTEGAGVGAVVAMVVSIIRGMRWAGIYDVVLAVGRSATPIMAIIFSAQLYSRTLSMSGIGTTIQNSMIDIGLPVWGTVLLMIAIWFLLGMLIDSISIILLTVPVFAPVAARLGIDPIVFAMAGILTIEAGLVTPPFGINVYAVKTVVPERVSMGTIFLGSTPFWVMQLLLIGIIFAIPKTATFFMK